jgi:zinc transporter ZupT
MNKILKTLYNWRELWFWPLVALLNWYLLIHLAYFFTGRRPEENMDFLVGLGANILIAVMAITLVSILRESSGEWWSKDDLKQHPHLAYIAGAVKAIALVAFLWALKH